MHLKQLELAGGGTLTVYLRDCCERMPNVLDRPLVLVVPGGGYTHVSAREGDPVALQFAAAGYHTAVLDYAICEKAKDYMPLRQLAEAIGLVRQHAAQWHILPEKIAVCGFSAGGHLALSGAVLDIPGEAAQPRPNAVILGYPVVRRERRRTALPHLARDQHRRLRWARQGSMPTAAALCSWRAAPTRRHSRCSGWRIRSRRRRRRCSYGPPWRMPPFRWRTP